MRIRNHTGVDQMVVGSHLPAGAWLSAPSDLSYEAAMEALRLNLVDVLPAESGTQGLFWMSALSHGDGYGTAAENYLLEMRHMISPIFVRDCWFRIDEGLDAYTIQALREPVTALPERGICMATPGQFRYLPTKYRVGYTMYESSNPLAVHPEWRHDVGCMDKLVVPSPYSKDVFAEFFPGPIDVVDLVVHSDFYTHHKRVAKDTFTFIEYATLSGRKSAHETLLTFLAAFPKEQYPDVRLEMKTRGSVFGGQRGHVPNIDDDRIRIIDTTWNRSELIDWLHRSDCMLFCSKGEGYGMPPREAICTGLPTIYAHNSGMEDLVKYGIPVQTDKYEDSPIGGEWAIPDWGEMVDTMRDVYASREKYFDKAVDASYRYVADKASATAKLLKAIKGTKVRRTHEDDVDADHSLFYERFRQQVPTGRVLVFGEGADVLGAMGYDVILSNRPIWDARIGDFPRVDAVVLVDQVQKYHHTELTKAFNNLIEIAPIYWTTATAWNFAIDGARDYLRQRGEWAAILQGLHHEEQFYQDRGYLMGIVYGMAVRAQAVETGLYRGGVWNPVVIG